jgi:uroporphyrinogen-III synthase
VIPFVVPPLSGLTVLVTRPAAQAATLCARIEMLGGTSIAFPAIEIEPVAADAGGEYDLFVFVSANAVVHGAHLVTRGARSRIAAIGKATAAALAAAGLPADIVPVAGADSESLLDHPDIVSGSFSSVLIVRGVGGRELLQTRFTARGAIVDTREVYRRAKPTVAAERITAIESLWSEEGIDVVTVTSVENLRLLMELLTAKGNELLRRTPVLVASGRIGTALEECGLQGGAILAYGADDDSMVGALARWNTRERVK